MPPVANFAAAAFTSCVLLAGTLHAADPAARGLRFDSPAVLDLSGQTLQLPGGRVGVASLPPDQAAQIVDAPTIDAQHPGLAFSDDVYGCAKPSRACSQQHEASLVRSAAGSVRRNGKTLQIQPAHGAAVTFVDWTDAASKTADGDSETHWYLGRMPGSGYQRVEVAFGQDAPGSFLLNPANGSAAFVHNVGDVTALAPDGLHLLAFNADNPPLSLRVAALDANGPSLELLCSAEHDSGNVHPQFKGWPNAQGFDLVLEIHALRSRLARRIALRVTRNATGWTLQTPDASALEEIGFGCRQAPAVADTQR